MKTATIGDRSHFKRVQVIGSPLEAGNGLDLNPGASGAASEINAIGDDTNVGINITPKGTGKVTITGDGARQFAEVTVSSAELLALRATPKTLVAAPGAGKMLVFHDAMIIADNGTAYVVGTNDFAIRYNNTTGDIISQTIDSAGLLDQTTDIMSYVGPIATDSKTPKADCENTPLVLHNTGAAEWTTGNGVVRVKIYYSVVTTGW